METLTLFQLHERIKRAILLNFRESIWVSAEIAQISNSKGHVYLEIIEKNEFSGDVVAKGRGILWAGTHHQVRTKYGDITNDLLKSGVQVLLKLKPEFHENFGFSHIIEDIDPSFTIGKLELERKKTLEILEKEGLLELNSSQILSLVVQKIAVISSPTAAGYQDFMEQLNTYYFETTLFPVAVQGEQVVPEIVEALNEIEKKKLEFDVVVIIRGGGSKMDLSAFDDLLLCKRISTMGLPVITGIGHERDQSIADLVAHTHLKTPTAVAEFLVQRNWNFESLLIAKMQFIQTKSMQVISEEWTILEKFKSRFELKSQQIIEKNLQNLEFIQNKIIQKFNFIITQSLTELNSIQYRLEIAHPNKILERGYALIRDKSQKILGFNDLYEGDLVNIEMKKGTVEVEVKQKFK